MTNRQSWDEFWMLNAVIYSTRSTCCFYKVGIVIVRNKHLLSGGYNGSVPGDVHCDEVGCAKIIDGKKAPPGSNLCRGAHAEMNAINFAKCDLTGGVLYTTIRPCLDCAKQVIQAGIKKVVFLEDYDGDGNATKKLTEMGVEMVRFNDLYPEDFSDFRINYQRGRFLK